MRCGNSYGSDMATDKAKLMVYVDPKYKEGLGKLAALENRSMSNYVETLIIEAVDRAIQEGKIAPEEGSSG
jgi:predicted HicB family RNase H-like nuclease